MIREEEEITVNIKSQPNQQINQELEKAYKILLENRQKKKDMWK